MLALVTGASSGIGKEYARQLARDYGCDLLLVSNQQEELEHVAQEIAAQYGVQAMAHYADLGLPDAADRLFAYTESAGMEPDILVNDAGVFFFNPYIETSMSRIELMLNLHVVTVAKLCRLYGGRMARRGSGYILNMSSMSAWMAMPGIQTYNATKAFIYNFSKALYYELRPKGVWVTVMAPGAVDTALFGLSPRLRRLAVAMTVSIPPDRLVRRALKDLFKGRKADTPGFLNWLATPLLRHTPDWLMNAVYRRVGKYQK